MSSALYRYIREAENLREAFGAVFPAIPAELVAGIEGAPRRRRGPIR